MCRNVWPCRARTKYPYNCAVLGSSQRHTRPLENIMTLSAMIGTATEYDLDGIMALQEANQPAQGGYLSANLPRARIAEMMAVMPLVVARQGEAICGFLMTSTLAMNRDVPIIRAMLNAYPGAADAYVYGPVCVREDSRGRGLAQAMYIELRRLLPGREGILFVRRDNPASLRAHEKMGMREVAGFIFDGNDCAVFSYSG